jgi:hypothetical protein
VSAFCVLQTDNLRLYSSNYAALALIVSCFCVFSNFWFGVSLTAAIVFTVPLLGLRAVQNRPLIQRSFFALALLLLIQVAFRTLATCFVAAALSAVLVAAHAALRAPSKTKTDPSFSERGQANPAFASALAGDLAHLQEKRKLAQQQLFDGAESDEIQRRSSSSLVDAEEGFSRTELGFDSTGGDASSAHSSFAQQVYSPTGVQQRRGGPPQQHQSAAPFDVSGGLPGSGSRTPVQPAMGGMGAPSGHVPPGGMYPRPLAAPPVPAIAQYSTQFFHPRQEAGNAGGGGSKRFD